MPAATTLITGAAINPHGVVISDAFLEIKSVVKDGVAVSSTDVAAKANNPLIDVTVTSGGSGYTSAPTVTISGGGGAGATATAVVVDGVVTEVRITDMGTAAYTSAPTIGFSGGGGTGAAATAAVLSYGWFKFTLLRNSVVYLYGNIERVNKRDRYGHPVTIPNAATATLESILPAITLTLNNVTQGQVAELETDLAAALERIDELEEGGSGGVGAVLSAALGAAVGVDALSTAYHTFGHDQAAFFPGEAARQMMVPVAGTLGNFYVRAYNPQPADAPLVLTIRVNGVDTAITITIPANGTGIFSDTTHTAAVAAGDLISFKGVNASEEESTSLWQWSILLT